MTANIDLKIYMPEKLVLCQKVYRVVLPADDMPLTVIQGRAPTLMALDMGAVKILDERGEATEEWLISGGSADIREDACTILTEAAFAKKELSLEKARALNEEFANPFYEWLISYFEKENGKKENGKK